MNDWFEWNGTRCTDYGIHVSEQPPLTIPKLRSSQVSVPGKPGSLTVTEGGLVYEDVTKTVNCFVTDSSRVSDIAQWLRGSGKVTFANRPGGFYHAHVSDLVTFEQLMRGRTALGFSVSFLCGPFWYAFPEDVTITEPGYYLSNENAALPAEPIISVYGNGEINLMINENTILLDDVDGNITIDSEAGMVYTMDGSNVKSFAGDKVTLEDGIWPTLRAGGEMNYFNWGGIGNSSVTRIVVQPNWRWL